nr:hypothetical protein [Micromonospora provocatoris]
MTASPAGRFPVRTQRARSSQAAPASAGLNSQCCAVRTARCTSSRDRPCRATSRAYACSMCNGTNRSPSPCRLSTGAVGRPAIRGTSVRPGESRWRRFSGATRCTVASRFTGWFGVYRVNRFVAS